MVAVKAYWTPGTPGNTGKLYARELTNKAWTLIGSGTTSPIDGTGLTAGRTYEFIVEEYVGDYSGLASNALRRLFGTTAGMRLAYYRITNIVALPGTSRKVLALERLEKPIVPR